MLQTDDLFLGAFGLLCGGELVGLEVHGVNGRRSAVFRIEGRGLEAAERDYYRLPRQTSVAGAFAGGRVRSPVSAPWRPGLSLPATPTLSSPSNGT